MIGVPLKVRELIAKKLTGLRYSSQKSNEHMSGSWAVSQRRI